MIVDPVDPNWASDTDGTLMAGVHVLPYARDAEPPTVDQVAAAPIVGYARADQFGQGRPA